MLLASMKEGDRARLLGFFASERPSTFFVSRGIMPGVRVRVLRRYARSLVVRFDCVVFAIGIDLAMSVRVGPEE